MDNLIGQNLGQYKIVSLLGTGGMAAVYRARQESIERDVAIKVIRPQLSELDSFIVRFRREAKLVASFSHPHIVKVFDYGQFEDMAYLVMELLNGGSLAQVIRQGPLPLELTGQMLDQIASALDFAHQMGVIHRDLKPQNVLLDSRQNAFLTDFGIAKLVEDNANLTVSGTVMGTPAYMSPEQWSGQAIDGRADIYALGVMLFEMLTGRVPFNGNTPFLLMHQHIYETPRSVSEVNENVPPAIAELVNQALAKNRDDRFNTAKELADSFRDVITSSGSIAGTKSATRPPSATKAVPPRDSKTVVVNPTPPVNPPASTATASRRPLWFGLIGAVAVIALIAVGAVILSPKNPPAVNTNTAVALLATTGQPTPLTPASPVPDADPSAIGIAAVAATSSPTASPSPSLTLTISNTPTPTPTATLTSTIDEEGTLNAAVGLTETPIARASQVAATIAARLTQTERAKPTATLTPSNTPSATLTPTATFTRTPTVPPTDIPTDSPTDVPTVPQTPEASRVPTDMPNNGIGALGYVALQIGSAGSGVGHFQDLRFVTVDANGNYYTGEYSSARIQKFDKNNNYVTSWTPAGKNSLRGLAADHNGNVYAVRGGQIFKFDTNGKLLKTFNSTFPEYDDVAILPDNNLLVAAVDASSDDLVKLNANTGAEIAHFSKAISSQTDNPELEMRVAVDGLGTIYALGTFSNAVFIFSAAGKFQNRIGSLQFADSLAVDSKSRVFVSDFGSITVFNKDGSTVGTISVPNNQAFQPALDDKGTMYVASRDRVYKITLTLP